MSRYFNNPRNLEDLRQQYFALLKKYHPDNGGSNEAAQAINAEYERLFETLKHARRADDKGASKTSKASAFDASIDEALRDALKKIIHLDGIEVEICGTWIWVTGKTYPVRDALKAAGFRWCSKKKAWNFHVGNYRKSNSKEYDMSDIRALHGSVKVATRPAYLLN